MKRTKLPIVVLLVITAILGGSLIYEIAQRQRAAKGQAQFIVAISVQLHQGLERGDVEAVKRRLGPLVTVQSEGYEQRYGREVSTEFARRLAEAKVIRDEFEAASK